MKIDVVDLLKRVGNETEIIEEETLSFPEDELFLVGPVKFEVHLINTGDAILVSGRIEATVRMNCVRCLKEFDQPMAVDIEEEYTTEAVSKAIRSGEIELRDEDFKFKIDSDNTIDLTEAIRQNLITALPIKPLCKKACAGIKAPGAAGKPEPDPRLIKLKDVLKEQRKD